MLNVDFNSLTLEPTIHGWWVVCEKISSLQIYKQPHLANRNILIS